MSRRAHWLKANKKVEIPVHCIFYDTETKSEAISDDTEQAKLWFGWACYIRRYRDSTWGKPTWFRYSRAGEFWRWVGEHSKPKRKTYLFAHNTGFDFTVLQGFRWARRFNWANTGRIIDDPPTVIRFRRDSHTLCFIDTLNFYRMSLKELGGIVGLEKYEFPSEGQTEEEWDIYCRRDIEIMVKGMQMFWKMVTDWQLGNFAYTLPAQAFAAYRHKFMHTPIFIDDNEKATELARKAYIGGRTECFRIGKINETVHCLDINSQYPFIMATMPVPIRLVTTLRRVSLSELISLLQTYCLVADVTLTTSQANYPKKIPGWTIFPIGTFRTVLNTPELNLALIQGHVKCIQRVIVYEKAVIFREYVNFFYEQRMEARVQGNEALATMLKLMMNSLYGKFGQTGRKYEKVWEVPNDAINTWVEWDRDGQSLHRYRQFAGVVEELQRDAESRESFPAIAGHITSAARMLLLDGISQAGEGNTLYCDTDSLFVNARGFDNLSGRISDAQLGWLKHEWESDSVTIHGVKDYEVGGRLKRKGIRSDSTEIEPATYQQVEFRGLKGMVQDKDLDRLLIKQVTKHLHRVYSKGEVDSEGIVHPLVFPHPLYPD